MNLSTMTPLKPLETLTAYAADGSTAALTTGSRRGPLPAALTEDLTKVAVTPGEAVTLVTGAS